MPLGTMTDGQEMSPEQEESPSLTPAHALQGRVYKEYPNSGGLRARGRGSEECGPPACQAKGAVGRAPLNLQKRPLWPQNHPQAWAGLLEHKLPGPSPRTSGSANVVCGPQAPESNQVTQIHGPRDHTVRTTARETRGQKRNSLDRLTCH